MLNLKPPPPSYRDLLRKSELKLKLKLKLGLRSEFKPQSGMELEFKSELEYELRLEYQFKITTSLIYIHIYPMSPNAPSMPPPCPFFSFSLFSLLLRKQTAKTTRNSSYIVRAVSARGDMSLSFTLSFFSSFIRSCGGGMWACGRVGIASLPSE
jgi:hypothetical protein